MTRSKRLLPALTAGIVLFCAGVFLSSPARYARSVLDGISLWAVNVLPATFPFLFLTALFTGLPLFARIERAIAPAAGKLFRVSGAGGGAALLSALSGYPVGARLIADLWESGGISREETFRLACLCSTSGPMFLVGTVGSILYESPAAGWILLASHLLAVFSVCLVLRIGGTCGTAPPPPKRSDPALLYDSLYRAVISILCVGGFIALFSCLGQMLEDLGLFRLFGSPYFAGLFKGLLEMTTGCAALSALKTPLSLALSCALVTFGGMCVLCQQAAYLTPVGVKLLPFLGVKAVQAALAFGICLALSALL